MIPDERLRQLLQDAEHDVQAEPGGLESAYRAVEDHRGSRRRAVGWPGRTSRFGTALVFTALILAAIVGSLLIAGGGFPLPRPGPTPEPSLTLPELTEGQWQWCRLHTGGPGADQHQVEDQALKFGAARYGWVTRGDVFGRWQEPQDLLRVDVTFRQACLAALSSPDEGVLTPAQEQWCQAHIGGPAADQHQVEDEAIALGIPGLTSRPAVVDRWAGTISERRQDPVYRRVCASAAAKGDIPVPSTTGSDAPSPSS